MRHPRLPSIMIVATAFAVVGVLAPVSVPAQQPPAQPKAPAQSPAPAQSQAPAPPQAPAPAKPGPYNVVAIKLPAPVSDASFEAFRKQLADIAKKKDRAALARLLAANFFWIPEDADVADKTKPAIDNLAKAIGLDGKDAIRLGRARRICGRDHRQPRSPAPGRDLLARRAGLRREGGRRARQCDADRRLRLGLSGARRRRGPLGTAAADCGGGREARPLSGAGARRRLARQRGHGDRS